jgi:transcription antitermination factor NusG
MAKGINAFGGDEVEIQPAVAIENQSAKADKIVETQWHAYERGRDAGHLDWIEEARKYDEYYYGDQWDDDVKATLDAQKRPAHTVNLVLSTVNAVIGEYIKSRQEITFQPIGKGAQQDTADSLRFLFKQIALNNASEQKEKTVFTDGLIQDRGYFYYYLDFSDNLQGEIREEVIDPTDVIIDPGANDYDPATWSEVFISRWLTPDQIGALYGMKFRDRIELAAAAGTFGHDSLEWESPTFSGDHFDSELYFQTDPDEVKKVKRLRVIERQHRVLARTAFFVDRPTGDMRRVPEDWEKERVQKFAAENNLTILWKPERRIRITITADKTLLHDEWSLFSKISLIPFFPYFRRGRPFGLVRNLISPQDMLNKVTSQELHVVNTTANSGWIFQTGSLVNMDRDDLVTQGSKTGLVLEVMQGAEQPQKIQPNQIPTGLAEIGSKAGVFFKEISGVNEAQLGTGRSDSSKALESRKQGGLIQQEIIFDNLALTRRLRAELMLEIVQNYYTETRLIQVFSKNEDGDEIQQEISVNQPIGLIDQETQESVEEIKNDLTIGEYSVVISTVPRRDTYEESLFDQLIQMREIGVQIPDYILVEASQLPEKRELVQTIKEITGLAAPSPEEIQRQQQLAELEMRMLTAEVMEKEAHATERQAAAMKLQAQAQSEVAAPQIKQLEIGTKARVEMEKASLQSQDNQDDLMTRIRIAQGKEGTMRDIAKIESMTTRNAAGLKNRTDITKSLLSLREKAQERSAAQKERKKSAKK